MRQSNLMKNKIAALPSVVRNDIVYKEIIISSDIRQGNPEEQRADFSPENS